MKFSFVVVVVVVVVVVKLCHFCVNCSKAAAECFGQNHELQ